MCILHNRCMYQWCCSLRNFNLSLRSYDCVLHLQTFAKRSMILLAMATEFRYFFYVNPSKSSKKMNTHQVRTPGSVTSVLDVTKISTTRSMERHFSSKSGAFQQIWARRQCKQAMNNLSEIKCIHKQIACWVGLSTPTRVDVPRCIKRYADMKYVTQDPCTSQHNQKSELMEMARQSTYTLQQYGEEFCV